MTTMATTTANRASASTPFATRGASVRSRAFSHFLPNFFFSVCVFIAALVSFYSLSLSLSLSVPSAVGEPFFGVSSRGIPRFFLHLTRAIFSRFFL
jgi:hypothetical protein